MEHLKAGQYAKACPAIAESQRLDPHPGSLFTLAVCEERWGHIASAVTHYGAYLPVYDRLSKAEQLQQGRRPEEAKNRIAALTPDVPELTLLLPPSGLLAGTIVKRDDAVLSDASFGISLPVDPGEHVVTTQAPGGPVWEQRLTIDKKDKKTLALEVKSPPPPQAKSEAKAPPPEVNPPPTVDTSGRRVGAYVIGGVGLAGLALGAVMGGLTFAQKSTVSAHCGKAIGASDGLACDQTGFTAVKTGRTMGLVSSIALGVGAAGVGAGAIFLLTAPTSPKPVTGGSGRWMSAGVLGATPEGAVLGVHGGW